MCELEYYWILICSKSLQCATLHQVRYGRSHIPGRFCIFYSLGNEIYHQNCKSDHIPGRFCIFFSAFGMKYITRTVKVEMFVLHWPFSCKNKYTQKYTRYMCASMEQKSKITNKKQVNLLKICKPWKCTLRKWPLYSQYTHTLSIFIGVHVPVHVCDW